MIRRLFEKVRRAGVLLLFSALANVAPAQEPHPPLADLVYGQAGGKDLKLDLYPPTMRNGPAPVVIFLHGGGWRVGDKSGAKQVAGPLNAAGFAVASVNYRLSGTAIFPAQIVDCKAAVRWLRANAEKYQLDAKHFGVLGFSAGGHLAALLGTSEGVKSLEDPAEGSAGESTRIQAVCDVSGPVDLSIPTRSLIGKLSVRGELGGSAAQKPELVRAANPVTYLRRGDVAPFLIIQGDQDKLVLPEHARVLAAALRAKGVEATVLTVQGGGHVPFGEEEQKAATRFFERHLQR